ncbi:NAD-dependent epimerase/dehydratase family protein [Haliangium sp.]|uniref:NAD-dependent epimerase/dehydratase family protein n=1 Tax=Haliangium sp. TaxID=2663208 RepID=UPI003D10B32E
MSKQHDAPVHVVLGAGQIGIRVARLLVARGHRVRLVQRTADAGAPEGVEHLTGSILEHAFAERAGAGASVVYDCMNPPYHRWSELLLPVASGALHAAATAGARLVAIDNLYMYGRPTGPLREDSPLAPCSRKGALRAQLSELRLDAHRRGDVAVAIGRASDFFGAGLPWSNFSDRFWRRALAGKPVECTGDPDMPHSYTYVEDVARALVTLGEHEQALGRVWHLPTPPAESTRALCERIGRAVGLPITVARVPRWVLRAMGLVSPLMREVAEMAYQWEVPFVIDDARYRAGFGHGATPIDEAVAAVATWAREQYPELASRQVRAESDGQVAYSGR